MGDKANKAATNCQDTSSIAPSSTLSPTVSLPLRSATPSATAPTPTSCQKETESSFETTLSQSTDANDRSSQTIVHTMIQLPNEMWKRVIEHLPPKDLKSARGVNRAWSDFAAPLLFRNAVFSPEPANIKNLRLLAKNDHLAKHVENLYIDCTSNMSPHIITAHTYAKLASMYFSNVMALGPQPPNSPLCEKNLLQVLLTDSSKPLNHKFLTGKPRGHFIAGYTLYSARSSYALELFKDDHVYQVLELVTRKFKNLKHMETLAYWSTTESPYQHDFYRYLSTNLPRKSIDMISGLPDHSLISEKIKSFTSAFDAPGVSARDLHVMVVSPNYSGCYGTVNWHELVNPALRALRENKIKLDSLSLPGRDFLGDRSHGSRKTGMLPLPSLLEGAKAHFASKTSTILLPLFRHLKSLELIIDFKHPGNDMRRPRDVMQEDRLCKALQQMKNIESLTLGAPTYLLCDPSVWDLSKLLLYKEEDYAPDDDNDEDDDALGGPPGDVQDMLSAIFGPLMGTAQTVNAGGPTAPPGPGTSTSQGPASTSTAAGGNSTAGPGAPSAFTLGQIFGSTVDQTGNLLSFDLGAGAPPGFKGKTATPKTPLEPNPWPKLKYLALYNLPSSPNEVSRLVTTVKNSLKVLKMRNIHYEDHAGALGQHDHFSLTGNGLLGSNQEVNNDDEDAGDSDDDDDLPSLVGMEDSSKPPTSAPEKNSQHTTTSATATGQQGTQGQSLPHASTTPLPGSFPTSTFPLFGGPLPQPPAASQSSENNDSVGSKKSDIADQWLATIELLSDELRLDECALQLHEAEQAKLRVKLTKEVKDLWMIDPFGDMIDKYLLEGSGMGLPLFLSNEAQQIKSEAHARRIRDMAMTVMPDSKLAGLEEEESWDDVGSDEDLDDDASEDERPPSFPYVHICSQWQACP